MRTPEEKAEQYANCFTAHPRKDLAPWQEEIRDHHLAGQKCALESDEVKGLVEALNKSLGCNVARVQGCFGCDAISQFEKASGLK